MNLLPADRARLARRERPTEFVRHLGVLSRPSVRPARRRPPPSAAASASSARASVSAAASAASSLDASAARASSSSACARSATGLRRLDLRDVAFVRLHQARERPEALAVSEEGCDVGELGFAGPRVASSASRRTFSAAATQRRRHASAAAEDSTSASSGSAPAISMSVAMRPFAEEASPPRHRAPSPGARPPGRPTPAPAAVARDRSAAVARLVELRARLDDPLALLAERRELQVDPLHAHLRHAERLVEPLEPEHALQHLVALSRASPSGTPRTGSAPAAPTDRTS